MSREVRAGATNIIKRGMGLLPLVRHLVRAFNKSDTGSYYKPADLRDLPVSGQVREDSIFMGDYNYERRRGRNPEKSLGLPRARKHLNLGTNPAMDTKMYGGRASPPEGSAGVVGLKPRHLWEASEYDKYRSPLFKYRGERDRKAIRRRLDSYETPHIVPAPFHESMSPDLFNRLETEGQIPRAQWYRRGDSARDRKKLSDLLTRKPRY